MYGVVRVDPPVELTMRLVSIKDKVFEVGIRVALRDEPVGEEEAVVVVLGFQLVKSAVSVRVLLQVL